MPTAPTLVQSAYTQSSGVTIVSPTVSWQTGDVVVVLYGNAGAANDNNRTPTNTGSGLSWTVQKTVSAASCCGGQVSTAVATASSSGTITCGTTGTNQAQIVYVYVFRGSAGVGNSASTATPGTTKTLSLTPTAADSSIAWGVFDWNADSVQTITPTATSHSSSSPGPQATPQSILVSGQFTMYLAELDDQTSAGAVSYGIGGSNSGPFTIVALEVKGAAGGGTNGSVTAVAATVSVAAVAPAVSGTQNGSVTAVAATISTAAVAPVVSVGQNGSVSAVVATVSTAAVAPVVTGIRNATVSAVVATINTAAPIPAVAGEVVVSGGGPASLSLAANAPVVIGGANVTAVKATIAVAAVAPAVSTSGSINVNAVKATVAVAANAPVVAGGASLTAVKATLTTAAVAPGVAVNAFVQAIAATVTLAARAPVVFSPDARVNAVAAGILVQAIAPSHIGAQQTVFKFITPAPEIRYRLKIPESNLMKRVGIPTGETLIKEGGFYTLTESPIPDERIEAADAVYLGGHEYTLTPQEVTDLTNAGYGDNIRQELQG